MRVVLLRKGYGGEGVVRWKEERKKKGGGDMGGGGREGGRERVGEEG